MTERAAGAVQEAGSGVGAAAHLLRVAARLFASHGYDATSVRAIVEAAGVTKPTLYYHFGSKQGVAEALLRRPREALVVVLRDLVAGDLGPVALLRAMIEAHLRFCRDEPDCARFFFAILFAPENGSLAGSMCESSEGIKGVMQSAFDRIAALGLVDPDRIAALNRMFHGLVLVSTLDFLRFDRPLHPGLADDLTRDLLVGFARPGFTLDGLPAQERP